MRKFPLVIGLLACIPLAGCNWWPGHSPAPQRVIVTCRCTPPIRGPVGETGGVTRERDTYRHTRHVARHYTHHYAAYGHRNYAGSRRYLWNTRKAEASVDRYDYSSSSRVYRGSMQGHAYGDSHSEGWRSYGDNGYAQHSQLEGRYRGGAHVWVDGFGRRHLYDQSAVRYYSYQARMHQKVMPERLDPWHYYNEDWD